MKQSDTKKYWVSIIILMLLFGCGNSNQKGYETTPTAQKEVSRAQKSTSYYINNQDNQSIAEISIEDEEIFILMQSQELFGVKTKSDKRKYYNNSDAMRYAVKYSDDGFKLRDKNEQLLWKVKYSDSGIKMSNNEEMSEAFKITLGSEGKIKIKRQGDEIAVLRFQSGSNFIKVQDNYILNGFGNSMATGVFLIDQVSKEHKIMLSAELLNRGK